jgi:hypothetical protein
VNRYFDNRNPLTIDPSKNIKEGVLIQEESMVKKFALFVSLVALSLTLAGCTERQRQDLSHWKSDLIGLKRTITLYSHDGKPIKKWNGRFKVEVHGGAARFIVDGKAVIISGAYIIEETD